MATIVVNGARREVQSPADTPLLSVLRNDLELSGPQFGCGLAQCGACSVLLDGKDDTRVRLAPCQKRAMQAVKVAHVEAVKNTLLRCGPAQLILVKPANRSGILHGGHINTSRTEPLHKRATHGVFVQIKTNRGHESRR